MVRRRLGLLGLLFGLLLIALLVLPPSDQRLPPLTVYSSQPNGGRALRLWLEELGYRVATIENPDYTVPDRAGTLLVLAPTQPVTRNQVDELERWVKRGGRLVVVADGLNATTLLDRFGLRLRSVGPEVERATPLDSGVLDPQISEVLIRSNDQLLLDGGPATALLAADEHVFAARLAAESGEVFALSAPYAVSNDALRRADNARLALALVGPAARGTVLFDELHHGYGAPQSARGLTSLLLDHAWGRAALYAALVVLIYLALRGRRFGRPRPLIVSRGRSLAEYVTSLAALYRAGGKRAFIADHFHRRLRRELAGDFGLPATATDQQIEAAARALGRDPAPALRVLGGFGQPGGPAEADLIRLVRDGERARAALATRRIRA